ncbi:S9 family peptidase [Maricaulis sp.]|uniref:alpha/beta hydrolase family protein n=1 Tax=Maricaulis sp. TaxID=1486257 RepID=UPI002602B678|nr:S9 family peptidase [Maricaulis sp.]
MHRFTYTAFALALIGCPATLAQPTNVAGGHAGADMSIEAIEPDSEAIGVGLAGEDPADIGRYLMASGANGARLSPDGSRVAYSLGITGQAQLWISEADGGQPHQLTFGNGVSFFRWLPDGSGLIYGADNDGNERPAYYFVSADGSEERLILPATENGFRIFGDITADSDRIVYASTERNGLDFDIYVTMLSTGETRRVFEGEFAYLARAVSPGGERVIVTESVGEDSDNLYVLDLATGELNTLSRPDPRANHGDGGFAWSDDGQSVWFATNLENEFTAVTRYGFADGDMQTLFAIDADAGNVSLCGADDRYLAWTTNHDGFYRLHVRDLSSGEDVEPPGLPEGYYALSCSGASSRIAITINGWRTPGDIFVWDIATGEIGLAYRSTLAGLDPERLVRPESIRMTARDGVELQGLLYLPDETSAGGELPPLLVEVHGGPTGQSVASFDPVVQYHVDRGIAVFEPNVRGSTGFGRTYVTLDDRENRLDSVRDLIDMLDYLREDGRVDANRAAVSGGSYGGYMVNAVLANFPGHFIAGVSRYGVSDWVNALEIASPALKASDRIEYGDITDSDWRQYYTENSPIQQAGRIDVPVLYSHGVMDPRIDISETETMVRTLRENGVEAPFIRIPDEGHGWRKLANRLFYYRRQAEFVEEQLARE